MSKSPTDQRGRRLPPSARHRLERERQELAEWRRQHPGQTPDPEDWVFADMLGLGDDDMPRHRRHYYRAPDPEDEFADCDEKPEEALLDHLVNIDHQRQQLNLQRQSLQSLLDHYPQLAAKWRAFIAQGGISAEDFRKYLDGQWRARITRQRKHLRLIVNRRSKPVTIRGLAKDSDPAA